MHHHHADCDWNGNEVKAHRKLERVCAPLRHHLHRLNTSDQQSNEITAGQPFREGGSSGLPRGGHLAHENVEMDMLAVQIGRGDKRNAAQPKSTSAASSDQDRDELRT